jgi:probable phosphoglycerate mutase
MAGLPSLFRAPFYFLRHGETEMSRLGLVAGQQDIELNETGWRQARAAAGHLRDRGIDAIYSSALKRARSTADCVAAVLGLSIVIVPDLAERTWGELEGKARDLRLREATPRGGEGFDAFARRTLAGLASITRCTTPLVVAHSGTFRVLCDELRVAGSESAVEHCLPLRFVPPASMAAPWMIEPLGA